MVLTEYLHFIAEEGDGGEMRLWMEAGVLGMVTVFF